MLYFIAGGVDGMPTEAQQKKIAEMAERAKAMLDSKMKELDSIEQRIVSALVEAHGISQCNSYDAKLGYQVRVSDLFFDLLGELKPERKAVWEQRAKEIVEALRLIEGELQKELRGDTPVH